MYCLLDFFVVFDNGVKFVLVGGFCEVFGVVFECIEGIFGRCVIGCFFFVDFVYGCI